MNQLTPVVAIVGRPNVGKSTLFNRIVGQRRSIVHNQPGVTRDRVVELSPIDPGRPVQWIDTGGLVAGDDPYGVNEQVRLAVLESDLVLFLVDGVDGPTAADQHVLDALRVGSDSILLVVNKSDVRSAQEGVGEFWRLGLGEPQLVSSEHGLGIGDLLDQVRLRLPVVELPPASSEEPVAVAIVGRPNVGKSSIVNRILGQSRVAVSPTPGTTRDPIDARVSRDEGEFVLVDTAGIRRRSKVAGAPEGLAVMLARRQIERCQVAVLVIEAPSGVTAGDLAVAGTIWETGRAAVVVVNKWDLLDDEGRERLDRTWPRLAELLGEPPRLNASAETGRGVEKLFEHIVAAAKALRTEISTGELNRLVEEWLRRHRPPTVDGKLWKVFYATQVATGPPTLMLFANRGLPVSHSYRRYLENRLREHLDLDGIPIRLIVRRRSTRADAKT